MSHTVEDYGSACYVDALEAARARELGGFLQGRNDDVGCRLLEARQAEGMSWVIVEVDVDVGQKPAADVRRQETIALGFPVDDRAWPRVLALREAFPRETPHQFMTERGAPASLCLSEAIWDDARRRWSAGRFVNLLRTWLIDTARGALHRDDQALEPFLAGSPHRLILPSDVVARPGQPLFGYAIAPSPNQDPTVFRASWAQPATMTPTMVAATMTVPAKAHTGIRHTPRSLEDLKSALHVDGFDFDAALDTIVESWLNSEVPMNVLAILLVHIPVAREAGGTSERQDVLAFVLGDSLKALAVALDLRSIECGVLGPVLPSQRRAMRDDVPLDVLQVIFDLSDGMAAVLNGYDAPSGRNLVAVGAGALGSQIIGNLWRVGETVATICDSDTLLPHNLARHEVSHDSLVGRPKAAAMAMMGQSRFPGAPSVSALIVDAIRPEGEAGAALETLLANADAILDFAASVPVSRRLTLDQAGAARRISAFLSPNGRDLIVLAEDVERRTQLDHLELAYYAAVVERAELRGHFELPATTRYARGCRETSAQLAQAHVAVHAGIAADVIRRHLEISGALGAVWRLNPARMTVDRVDLDSRPMRSLQAGDWTVLVSEATLAALVHRRGEHLPNETGGALVGDFDVQRRRIYIASALDAPADSIETLSGFVRGAYQLQSALLDVEAHTLGMLQYVGEWHSHPDGVAAQPSTTDGTLYEHLKTEMEIEGYPPVMIIVAADHFSVVVDGVVETDRLGPAD